MAKARGSLLRTAQGGNAQTQHPFDSWSAGTDDSDVGLHGRVGLFDGFLSILAVDEESDEVLEPNDTDGDDCESEGEERDDDYFSTPAHMKIVNHPRRHYDHHDIG